jgi:gliding motility-associated lipoprotein GldH
MKNIFFVSLCMAFFWQCQSPCVYEKNASIPNQIWHRDSAVSFTFQVPDPSKNYYLNINLRHDLQYPYHNLNVFADLTYPNGKTQRDTLRFLLQNPETGRYTGKGNAGLFFNRIRYKLFEVQQAGTYKVVFEQAMRDENLLGVVDVGFCLEEVK